MEHPPDKERVTLLAEKVAGRLFVQTLQPNPLPAHPSGSALCFSLNYFKIEEDKTEIWEGTYGDFEEKELGMAAYVRDIPDEYFVGFPPTIHRVTQIVDLDRPDTHTMLDAVVFGEYREDATEGSTDRSPSKAL